MTTPNTTPLATEQEKIAILATKVMEWEKKENHIETLETEVYPVFFDGVMVTKADGSGWNPYTNWNHTHQVLDKLMEDEAIAQKFMDELAPFAENPYEIKSVLLKAPKEQLMDTLISLLHS